MMPLLRLLLLVVAVPVLCAVLPNADLDRSPSPNRPGGDARISFEHSQNRLVVQGLYAASSRDTRRLGYTLRVERHSPGGSTATEQSGTFTAGSQTPDTLSTVQVDAAAEQHVAATLTVSNGDTTLATARRTWTAR
ncbi:curli-like amyloid fiber formation chaperone CsgH [Longibacter sp.]|uniref:curli-like amyloid fiber formation chaperone CsgH n=1 Tax=Longibacter sp. TaxID=2045415 RepID=UPI003EB8B0FB